MHCGGTLDGRLSNQILSAVVFTETLSRGFRQFFPTGTYAGIGTTCVEFENVMKSATKIKYHNVAK